MCGLWSVGQGVDVGEGDSFGFVPLLLHSIFSFLLRRRPLLFLLVIFFILNYLIIMIALLYSPLFLLSCQIGLRFLLLFFFYFFLFF